jgi:hypothetical protein
MLALYRDSRKKQKADRDMQVLQSKVDAANQAQADNTRMYVESFAKMSSQIGDLKAEVKTEALQKKLTAVEAELLKTQKAMAPGPKAELTFSFDPYTNPPPPGLVVPSKEVTAPLKSDGTIHVEFSILNLTNVDAIDNALDIKICDQCKYAKEPTNSAKLPAMGETFRYLEVPSIHAREAFGSVSLDIIPPAGVPTILLGFQYRCRTCSVHAGRTPEATGIVHIVSP